MKLLKKLYRYIKYSKHRKTMFLTFVYSSIFRFQVKFIAPKRLEKNWGIKDEETDVKETDKNYQYAAISGYAVNRICKHTPWESKCLVRALTAQKLLRRKKISSTLYLGCKEENGKMVAHAWLRCGELFVTGGNGEGYAVVSRYASKTSEDQNVYNKRR